VGFVNDCDLSQVVRMYRLTHVDTEVFRGWQGHKVEQKWFHCADGAFEVSVVKPNDWQKPSGQEIIDRYVLEADEPVVLHVPGGYVTGIQALTPESTLMIFSDMSVTDSKLDDFRFDQSTWDKQAIS
jgi:dTDP-4-dehydrorhamnose 3,5-epimerase-like enzyme